MRNILYWYLDQFQIYAGKVFLSLTAYDSVDRQGTFLEKENGPPPTPLQKGQTSLHLLKSIDYMSKAN